MVNTKDVHCTWTLSLLQVFLATYRQTSSRGLGYDKSFFVADSVPPKLERSTADLLGMDHKNRI